MKIQKITTAILVVILILSSSACSPVSLPATATTTLIQFETATLTPLPTGATPVPALTATPVVLADCFVTFRLGAWEDLNEDGVWDASEPPLAGVKFPAPGRFAQYWGDPFVSGADGWLEISAWAPGNCPEQDIPVTVVPPESYELTTPASLTLSLTRGESAYAVQFGFRKVSQ